MGYRDDFYVEANIIGYSGNLHNFPTVYFQQGAAHGHITQKHDFPQNVGRQDVREDPDYAIGNEMVDESPRLVERSGDEIHHISRGALTRVEDMSPAQRAILAQAIWRWPDEKQIPSYDDDTIDIMYATMDAKTDAMTQLVFVQGARLRRRAMGHED